MVQTIEDSVWRAFEKAKQEKEKEVAGKLIVRSGEKKGSGITSRIASRIAVSDLANENNITRCPLCQYNIYFDDSNGWFCCKQAKWTKKENCDFAGNIIDFAKFCEDRQW